MDEDTIFQYISETQLLNVLARTQHPLTFVGEKQTISKLKTEFDSDTNQHTYCYWNLESENLQPELNHWTLNSTIVISSVYNENLIYHQFNNYLKKHSSQPKSCQIFRLFSDILVNLLSHQLPFQSSEIEFENPKTNYAIVTTPRSGSTFLCDLLQKSDIAGYPAEHLRRPAEVLARYCHFDYIRYMKIMMTRRVTPNKVFGTKLISHFIIDYRKEGLDFDSFFKTNFSKIIYLQRRDKAAQAVSLYLAKTTNIWHIFNEKMQEKYNHKINQIKVDNCQLEDIKSFYDFLLKQEKFVESFIKENRVTPLKIDYEDLVTSRNQYLKDIFDYLGIEADGYEADSFTGIKKTKSVLTDQLIEKLKDTYPSICQ